MEIRTGNAVNSISMLMYMEKSDCHVHFIYEKVERDKRLKRTLMIEWGKN